jgi:hypothetical protein
MHLRFTQRIGGAHKFTGAFFNAFFELRIKPFELGF